jgi:hypothetical protein
MSRIEVSPAIMAWIREDPKRRHLIRHATGYRVAWELYSGGEPLSAISVPVADLDRCMVAREVGAEMRNRAKACLLAGKAEALDAERLARLAITRHQQALEELIP